MSDFSDDAAGKWGEAIAEGKLIINKKETINDRIKNLVDDSMYQLTIRSLRDAPIYVNHVSMAKQDLVFRINELIGEFK